MIQAVAANGTHHPLNEWVLPGRPRCDHDFPDTQILNPRAIPRAVLDNLPSGTEWISPINRYARLPFLALAAFGISGCGGDTHDRVAHVGGYQLSMRTAPRPLVLGEKAQIIVELTDADERPAVRCRVRLRQYMPGMKMSLDTVYSPLHDAGDKGIYRGESGELSMGGHWVVELEISCRDEIYTQVFDYDLAW